MKLTRFLHQFLPLVSVMAAACAFGQIPSGLDYAPDRILVKFKPAFQSKADSIVHQVVGEISHRVEVLNILTVKLPPGVSVSDAVVAYQSRCDVQYAEPSWKRTPDMVPNDKFYGNQYGPKLIGMESVWEKTTGKSRVVIAVIDTGLDLTHPEFQGRILQGYDFSDQDNDPSDSEGHGTHCAGIAAAKGNNGIGVAGITWNTSILPVKIFPNAFSDVIIQAIKYSADKGANVITMSFGGTPASQAEQDAVNYAWEKNAVLFGSAGNDGVDLQRYPGNYDHVVTVGASDNFDQKAGFSNFGSWVEVTNAGVDIYSTLPGSYGYESGTSMSCPMTAGAAAALLSYAPKGFSNQKIVDAIESTAKNVGTWLNYGRVDVAAALKKIPAPISDSSLLVSISKYSGGATSGSVASARYADGISYGVNSIPAGAVGSLATARLVFNVSNTKGLASADLNLKSASMSNVTQMIYILNPVTKQYEILQSNPMKALFSTTKVSVANFSKYVAADGRVEFLARSVLPLRLAKSNAFYTLWVDMATIGLGYDGA